MEFLTYEDDIFCGQCGSNLKESHKDKILNIKQQAEVDGWIMNDEGNVCPKCKIVFMYKVIPLAREYAIYKDGIYILSMHNLQYVNDVCGMLNYDEQRYMEKKYEEK